MKKIIILIVVLSLFGCTTNKSLNQTPNHSFIDDAATDIKEVFGRDVYEIWD